MILGSYAILCRPLRSQNEDDGNIISTLDALEVVNIGYLLGTAIIGHKIKLFPGSSFVRAGENWIVRVQDIAEILE